MKTPTLDKLFDVETSTTMQDIKLIKVNRRVLQRFVMSYQACRPVILVKAAMLEVVSFPISIFNTERSMRQSQKSPLLKSILKFCKTSETAQILETTETNMQHIIDYILYIHVIKLSPKIKTFGDIGINVSDHKNGLTGITADLVGD